MIGAKARSLERLQHTGFHVPAFFTVEATDALVPSSIAARCEEILDGSEVARFAVRSSAEVEDGNDASYAGIFQTYLFVPTHEVVHRIRDVRSSGQSARAQTYGSLHSRQSVSVPCVIVQRMIDPDVAGVAFGRDPVDGSNNVVIAAARGVGTAVVDGEGNSDTYCVGADRAIVVRSVTDRRVLSDAQVRDVADAVGRVGHAFGAPQDIEWAIAGDELYLLQSRPVTTPAGIIWDNSNISESYGGIVLPLTFSFAVHAYAGAYRQFMRVLQISESTIAAHEPTLSNMLGSINGRMYYNLLNWYQLLALVPGFGLNRRFMESMMGVSEALPSETVEAIERTQKLGDSIAVARMLLAVAYHHLMLPREISRFRVFVDRALALTPRLSDLSLADLEAEFSRLESALLTNWQTPLVNDFFAMIYYGVLRQLCEKWCDDAEGTLQNDLLCAQGGMISAEPARRITELADIARADDHLVEAMSIGSLDAALLAVARNPAFSAAFQEYLNRFGDRCQSELKLESRTLRDDPRPLFAAVARLARNARDERSRGESALKARGLAETTSRTNLAASPLRSLAFNFVLARARERVRDRENLRFERTRVFGRVREIFIEVGKRLREDGWLDDARDVFYLELGELRQAIAIPALRASLRDVAQRRKEEYDRYAAIPAPPDRFTAIGNHAPESLPVIACSDEFERCGIGCCPGVVRGRVRIVCDPQTPLEVGEILVAERTDPGWVVLFPAAAGILVERGSVLSHAAIVSREMGIPSVVGLPGLTSWLKDGDLIEFDGRAGRVRRIEATTST